MSCWKQDYLLLTDAGIYPQIYHRTPWPLFDDRGTSNASKSLVLQMKEIDKQKLFGFARMSANRFDHLLEPIKPMILKKNAVRAPIPADESLA